MSEPAAPAARVEGIGVLVPDPLGGRLHNRHAVGDPVQGGLRLSLVEAAWCLLGGRLPVAGVASAADLLSRGADGSAYLAYCDLRERGLTVRHHAGGLGVWPRGQGVSGEPAYVVHPFGERQKVPAQGLLQLAGRVAALVDDDGAVTCYRVGEASPAGERPLAELAPMEGRLLGGRVLVEAPACLAWHAAEGVGVRHGTGLVLSLVEAEHLRRRGALACAGLQEAARGQPGLQARLAAQDALRARGAVAKSGFKFGTHLRAYRGDPDETHAEWLVQAAGPDEDLAWGDLARGIRVAHGVRKAFLVALAGEPVRFLELSWFRP